MSAAFSATIITAACVLADGIKGMTEASTMRSPLSPWTRSRSSTTASELVPIEQVPTGWYMLCPFARANSSH